MSATRMHVLAVKKWVPGSLGGITALRNISDMSWCHEHYSADPRCTRVMIVEVNGTKVTVLRDVIFRDRIPTDPDQAAEEERRVARLDDFTDPTVRSVLFDEVA